MLKSLFSYALLSTCLFTPVPVLAAIQMNEDQIEKLTALHAQADAFLAKDKCHEALVIYDEILLEEADDEVAYTNSGYCFMLLGQFEKAKESFAYALNINPGNEVAQMGLRKIHDPDGDWTTPND